MKLIIDISEDLYNNMKSRLKYQNETDNYLSVFEKIGIAVKNGTPLKAQATDVVSREAVEEITFQEPSYTDSYNILTEIREKVRALPSATPQPKVGRWKRIKKPYGTYFECSECGKKLNWIDRADFFCSKCGSDNSDSVKDWFDKWDSEIAKMEVNDDADCD